MEEVVFQPGAAKFGNFIDYYKFNPANNRIKFIPRDLLSLPCMEPGYAYPLLGLDIGCNVGNLTMGLFSHLTEGNIPQIDSTEDCDQNITTSNARFNDSVVEPVVAEKNEEYNYRPHLNIDCDKCKNQFHVLGVDIDPVLIQRAKESYPHQNITFEQLDVMDPEKASVLCTYLKKHGKIKFDFIFCFSVTMWIHLNHADDGLKTFLRKISDMTEFLVIEPQPWKCYKSAMRRLRKLKCKEFTIFEDLKLRENVSDEIVTFLENSCGMKLIRRLGVTDWDRQLLLFHRDNKNI